MIASHIFSLDTPNTSGYQISNIPLSEQMTSGYYISDILNILIPSETDSLQSVLLHALTSSHPLRPDLHEEKPARILS